MHTCYAHDSGTLEELRRAGLRESSHPHRMVASLPKYLYLAKVGTAVQAVAVKISHGRPVRKERRQARKPAPDLSLQLVLITKI